VSVWRAGGINMQQRDRAPYVRTRSYAHETAPVKAGEGERVAEGPDDGIAASNSKSPQVFPGIFILYSLS